MVQITTDSQGRFSTELSNISVGEHTITIEYAGDDKYTSSTVTRDITVVEHIYAIDLYSNNPEIETGDSTSVIATLTDDNIAVAGETLNYQIKHGSTVLDSGSATTDAYGQITITYLGTGIGDVDVIVTYDSLTGTYGIVDALFYDNQSTDRTSEYIVKQGTMTKTYTENQYISIQGGVNEFNSMSPVTLSTADNWSVEADMQQINVPSRIFVGFILLSASNSNNYISFLIYTNETASYGYGSPGTYLFRDNSLAGNTNTWYHMKWELVDGELKYYVYNETGTTLLFSKTVTLPSNYSNVNVYPCIGRYENSQTSRIRNVIVKAL